MATRSPYAPRSRRTIPIVTTSDRIHLSCIHDPCRGGSDTHLPPAIVMAKYPNCHDFATARRGLPREDHQHRRQTHAQRADRFLGGLALDRQGGLGAAVEVECLDGSEL